MVLIQIAVLPTTNNRFYPIGIAGKCSVRVLGVQYRDSTGNHGQLISIQSDTLFFPYSPTRYLTFMTGASATVSLDQGHEEYHLKNVAVNGGFHIYVIDRATGQTPAGFAFCLISLSVEHINETLE